MTYVIDCLYDARDKRVNRIKQLLEDPNYLKVFHGCSQDVLRLRKDWNCFPVACVDIQDMFCIWRNECPDEMLKTCLNPAIEHLHGRGKNITESQAKEFLFNNDAMPLEFFGRCFPFNSKIFNKNKIASVADFRTRPLHQDLINYSAMDATATLYFFYELACMVSFQ